MPNLIQLLPQPQLRPLVAVAVLVALAALTEWWVRLRRRPAPPAHPIRLELRHARHGREYLAVCDRCGVLPNQFFSLYDEACAAAVLHCIRTGGALNELPREPQVVDQ